MTGNYYNQQQPEYYESQPTSTQSSFGERPFQRSVDDNSNYWSNNKEYSTPNYSRQDMTWNNQQQQAYRQSKFNRDPQWPQRQTFNYGGGGGQQKESYYHGDSSQSRFGGKGAGGGGGRQGGIDDDGEQSIFLFYFVFATRIWKRDSRTATTKRAILL